ncbi:hypothetical protein JXI42_03745 [bacterium]|nr:hypothetical protein [bacterium]
MNDNKKKEFSAYVLGIFFISFISCMVIISLNPLYSTPNRNAYEGKANFPNLFLTDSLWFWEETECNDSNIVHICYNLSGVTANVSIQMSADGGESWTVPMLTLRNEEGDMGEGVEPGIHCFDWLMSEDLPDTEGYNWMVKLNTFVLLDTFIFVDSTDISSYIFYGFGLGFGDGFYWVYDYETGYVHQTPILNHLSRDSIISSYYIGARHNCDISYCDSFIYYGRSGRECDSIYRYNLRSDSPELVFYAPDASWNLQGIHCSGSDVFVSADIPAEVTQMVFKVDMSSLPSTRVDTIISNPWRACTAIEGGAFAFGYLWGCNNFGNIIQIDIEDYEIVGCYPVPNDGTGAEGLCWDGEYLCYHNYRTNYIYMIMILDTLSLSYSNLVPLDSRHPSLNIECPYDILYSGHNTTIVWEIDDLFWVGQPSRLFFSYCGMHEEHEVYGTEYDWVVPAVECPSCTLIVAARDSFCNWGYDTCIFQILPAATGDSIWFWEETDCNDSNIVHICYNLAGDTANANIQMSSDGGVSWSVPLFTLRNEEGDIGEGVLPGEHCYEWIMSEDLPDREDCSFQVSLCHSEITTLRYSTYSDFMAGDTAQVKILSPDPDGEDDGALWLPPGGDTIKAVQVYPDGHCTYCMSSGIYSYISEGSPPMNIKIYLIPRTTFNAQAFTATSILQVRYIDPGGVIHSVEEKSFAFFNIAIMGAANRFGARDNDLTANSADALRAFCRLGKGLLNTHDTMGHGSYVNHPYFCSLSDITGLSCEYATAWPNYTTAYRVPGVDPDLPILNVPFEIPNSFTTLQCHWYGQTLVAGDFLYSGASSGDWYKLYWHSYHNPEYDCYSNFFSYGNTEDVPEEWESKAMINSIYFSTHGGTETGIYTSEPYFSTEVCSLLSFDYSITLPESSSITIEIALDTTISATSTWTEWCDISDTAALPFGGIYGLKYRVLMELSPTGESPILHWISFTFLMDTSVYSTIECLDSRHPSVTIECPDDTVYPGDTIEFSWHVDDMFWINHPCSVFFNYCGIEETYLTTDTLISWEIPDVSCDEVYFNVTLRDSFCNWGENFCDFYIALGGTLYLSLPDTAAYPGDTLILPVWYKSTQERYVSDFESIISYNPVIVKPLSLISEGAVMDSWTHVALDTAVIGQITISGSGTLSLLDTVLCYIEAVVPVSAPEGGFTELLIDSVDLHEDSIPVYTEDGFLIVLLSPAEWQFDLTFDGDDYGINTTITMGLSFHGSEMYDAGLDIIFLPVPNQTVVWFVLNDPSAPHISELLRDIRGVWDIPVCWLINTSKGPGDMYWDPESLPPGNFMLNSLLDMRTNDHYRYSNLEIIEICYTRPRPVDFTFHLYEGWNMVSFPVLPVFDDIRAVFPSTFVNAYWYDPESRTYIETSMPERGKGYWVFSRYEDTVRIAGFPINEYRLNVFAGWNMVGSIMGEISFSEIMFDPLESFISPQYTYSPVGYIPVSEIIPTKGYWCLSTGNSIIFVAP